MSRTPTFLALGLAVASSVNVAAAQTAGAHPDRTLFKRAEREAEVRFADRVTGSVPGFAPNALARIGTEDGEESTLFGDMVDVAMIDDTTIAILDQSAAQIRLFTTSGRHLQTFGRRGGGPGEFRGLASIARTPDGELVVGDIGRRGLQYFGRAARGYEYRRTVAVPIAARSMCYVGSRLFTSGASMEEGTSISEIGADGAVVRTFGKVYESKHAQLNYQVAQGRVVCDTQRQLVYLLAGQMAGEVRAYRLDGTEVWRVWVSDYATNRIREQPDGGLAVDRSPVGAHASAALTMTASGQLVAQWLFTTRAQMDAREPGTQVQSVLIDPATGRAQNAGTGLPLLKAQSARHALAYASDPFPQLTVLSVRR